jgi:hypothetical protein
VHPLQYVQVSKGQVFRIVNGQSNGMLTQHIVGFREHLLSLLSGQSFRVFEDLWLEGQLLLLNLFRNLGETLPIEITELFVNFSLL